MTGKNNKIVGIIICFWAVICMLSISVRALGVHPPRLVDDASLLTDSEKTTLELKLNSLSEKYQCDVAVVTVTTTNGMDIMNYADDYYDYNGYGMGDQKSGILLVVQINEDGHGDYWMTTTGDAISVFTDAGIEYIKSDVVKGLKSQDYIGSFESFVNDCDLFLEQAATGQPYDTGHMPKRPFQLGKRLMISFGAALVISLIIVWVMASQLKSVGMKQGGSDYLRQGSFYVSGRTDRFLYHRITKRVKPKESSSSGSSTHSGSSGRSHGGGGGHF